MVELKITPQHIERDAYLYVRQSTVRQVVENNESTQRQYALRDRAVALGWQLEKIHVLDCDRQVRLSLSRPRRVSETGQ